MKIIACSRSKMDSTNIREMKKFMSSIVLLDGNENHDGDDM